MLQNIQTKTNIFKRQIKSQIQINNKRVYEHKLKELSQLYQNNHENTNNFEIFQNYNHSKYNLNFYQSINNNSKLPFKTNFSTFDDVSSKTNKNRYFNYNNVQEIDHSAMKMDT